MINTDIPLDKRIKALDDWLDTHDHDALVKYYGHCPICSHHLHDGFFRKCKCGMCEPDAHKQPNRKGVKQ